MGPLKVDLGSPTNFLKKGTGEQSVSPVRNAESTQTLRSTATKPPVPKHDELATLAPHHQRKFITENTLDVLRTVPKKPEAAILDQARGPGGRLVLEDSGLVPKYSVKETFGKVPDYLQRKKSDETRALQDEEAHVSAMSKLGAPRQLSQDERQSLLDGLKANWSQLHRDYQGLSVVVDTESKKQRKKAMEAKLAQLEGDIQRVEKHPIIYVEQ